MNEWMFFSFIADKLCLCFLLTKPSTIELTLKEARASLTLFSMKSSVMRREGCSLKTEFMRAILAALRLASALVGQNCQTVKNSGVSFCMQSDTHTNIKTQVGPVRSSSHTNKLQMPYLETSKAAASWKTNIANIRWAVGWDHFINNESSVPQVGPSGQLHLPKLL